MLHEAHLGEKILEKLPYRQLGDKLKPDEPQKSHKDPQ
jgi:hypothetical protein